MKLIIASNNKDKIAEIKAILSPFFDDIVSLREAGIDHETVEDGTSAQITPEEKNRIGHRAKALRAIVKKLLG